MVTASFVQDTYEVYDKHNRLLFNDHNHRYLFDYLYADFSQIEVMLKRFFSEQFDFVLVRLKEKRPALAYNDDYAKALKSNSFTSQWDYVIDNAHLREITDCIEKSHPYFMIDYNALKCVETVLVDFFNSKLCCCNEVLHESEYVKILEELLTIPPFPPVILRVTSSKITDFRLDILNHYKDYLNKYTECGGLRRLLAKGIEVESPLPTIVEEQRLINKRLQNLSCVSNPITNNKTNEIFTVELDMRLLVYIEGNIIREKFSIYNIGQLLDYEVFQIVKTRVKLKKCRHCNAFFVVNDMRKNYCDRVVDGNKTCRDIGPYLYYKTQKVDDDMYKSYRKAFSKNKMRHTRGVITDEQFNYWQEKANDKRKAKSEDFDKWIDLTINEIRDMYKKV